jgi:hypothetical protein
MAEKLAQTQKYSKVLAELRSAQAASDSEEPTYLLFTQLFSQRESSNAGYES